MIDFFISSLFHHPDIAQPGEHPERPFIYRVTGVAQPVTVPTGGIITILLKYFLLVNIFVDILLYLQYEIAINHPVYEKIHCANS